MKLLTFTNLVVVFFFVYLGITLHAGVTFFYPAQHQGPGQGHGPSWDSEQLIDFYLYQSTSKTHPKGRPLISKFNIPLSDTFTQSTAIKIPKKTVDTGALYVHAYITKAKHPPMPDAGSGQHRLEYDALSVVHTMAPLTQMAPCKTENVRTLLDRKADEVLAKDKKCRHLRSKLKFQSVHDRTIYPKYNIPGDVHVYLKFDSALQYQPIFLAHEFGVLEEDLIQLNATSTNATVEFTYEPTSLGLFRVMNRLQMSVKMMENMAGPESDEPENLRRMFIANHPALLLTTLIVSLLHLCFDVLAFKNDISFWRSRKSMEGLSANNVVAELICSIIIFLYLWDTDTGILILGTQFVGLWIQLWKAHRALKLRALGKDSSTADADAKAMKWMGYVLYPLAMGYAGYSLLYREHKGFYSWMIEAMATAVYAFGFILMTPQLYINYKLKSVASLPWRVFGYRAVNTFIDDLFAFIMRMPTMHRLSCFRDDLVFVIYLYQRWLYPVDSSRIEGFEGEEESTPAKKLLDDHPKAPKVKNGTNGKKP